MRANAIPRARGLGILLLIGAALLVWSPRAEAGTYLKGMNCSIYKVGTCQMMFNASPYNPYQCYSRFVNTSPTPYPSHAAGIDGLNYGPAMPGVWTTAQSAYSVIDTCFINNSRAMGYQDTGSSRTFTYAIQLFSGGY